MAVKYKLSGSVVGANGIEKRSDLIRRLNAVSSQGNERNAFASSAHFRHVDVLRTKAITQEDDGPGDIRMLRAS